MRALVWNGQRDVAVTDVPEPEPTDGEVVVTVLRAGICGSDLHAYRGEGGGRVPPLVLGHEGVGTLEGRSEMVAIFPLVGCGHCDLCRRGDENLCRSRSLLGLHRPGTFAERVALPADRLMPVPANMTPALAALAEPLATSLAALDAYPLGDGHRVVVIGSGAIGLLALYVARGRGAEVDAVDPVESRRQVASLLGAAHIYENVGDVPPGTADVVVDAVGIEATWTTALAMLRPGGSLVVVGLGQQAGTVPVGLMVRAGLHMFGSYGYRRYDFAAAIDLLASDPPDVTWLTERPLEDAPSAFADLVDRPSEALKVLLVPGA